jgi:hypothetical protein
LEHIGAFGACAYSIGNLQLFRDSDEEALAAALAIAVVSLAQGKRLEDTFRARLYIVLRGALAEAAADGHVSKILPGESVGEQSVLDEATNLADIRALEDSELLVIEADLVWQLIERFNGVARNLLRLLSFRIRAASALLRRRQKLGEFYRQLSMNDGLTGLYNRAWLNDMLPKMVATAHRAGAAVAGDDRPRPFQALNDSRPPPATTPEPPPSTRRCGRPISRCATAAKRCWWCCRKRARRWRRWWPSGCARGSRKSSSSTTCARRCRT